MFPSRGMRWKFAAGVIAPIVLGPVAVVGMPQIAFGARPIPVVISFTANRTSITDTRGRIVLRTTLKYASSCEIPVIPSLRRLPYLASGRFAANAAWLLLKTTAHILGRWIRPIGLDEQSAP